MAFFLLVNRKTIIALSKTKALFYYIVLDNSNFNQKLFPVASSSDCNEDTTSSSECVKYDKSFPNASTLLKTFELKMSGNPGNASNTSQSVIANQKV